MALPIAGSASEVPNADEVRKTPGLKSPKGGLVLTRSLSKSTWSALWDGRQVVARNSSASPAELDDQAQPETVTRLVGVRSPLLVPFLGTVEFDSTSWFVSEHVDGVPLRRLLTMASLTPLQAAYIAARVLAAIGDLHRAGLAHGRLHAGNVMINCAGQAVVSDWAMSSLRPTSPTEDVLQADFESARALISLLIRSADRPAARNHGRHDRLFATMDRIRTNTKALNPIRAARELDNAILATSEDTGAVPLRAELAALVAKMNRTSAPDEPTPALSQPKVVEARPATATATPLFPPGSLSDAKLRRPPRSNVTRWIALAAVALVLVGAGVFASTKQGTSFTDRLLHRHASTSPAKAAKPATVPQKVAPKLAAHTPRPIGKLAPARAGFITGLALKPLTACRPGTPCPIQMTIRLGQLSGLEQMQWHFVLVNRCTGKRTTVAGGSMIGQPGWPFAFDSRTVPLPRARSLAVVGVTTTPVRTASPPLSMTSGGGKC